MSDAARLAEIRARREKATDERARTEMWTCQPAANPAAKGTVLRIKRRLADD